MTKQQKIIIAVIAILLAGSIVYFTVIRKVLRASKTKQIKVDESYSQILNEGPVSPITGLACENWNRRPIAVMQAADVPARPAAGLSQADMVIEMPVITASITRLMGIYICNSPSEVGSMRSARHDFVHLAKGLDAIFAHWGRSEIEWFKEKLSSGVIDNINCNSDAGRNGGHCCFRKEGMTRGVDSGYAKMEDFLKCSQEFGYRMENNFSGYPHQLETPLDERPQGGRLRVAFAGAYAAEYEYDRDSNSYKRIWGEIPDKDRNTGEQIAPKNVVVIFARSDQIEGQYNNVQLGDPWTDDTDSGEAHYYLNGKEYRGTWKKDKSDVGSKLFFYDESGKEIPFVQGQIWLEVLEPGQNLKWQPF
jgi:hypothetical protein